MRHQRIVPSKVRNSRPTNSSENALIFYFSADPATILSCVAIDAVGLVQVTKGNIRVFCTMAERFMECVKTKTRGCIGEEVRRKTISIGFCFSSKVRRTFSFLLFQFVRGSLSELIELSQKCCVNRDEKMSEECPFVSKFFEHRNSFVFRFSFCFSSSLLIVRNVFR